MVIGGALALAAALGLGVAGWLLGWPSWCGPALFGAFTAGGALVAVAAGADDLVAMLLSLATIVVALAALVAALAPQRHRPPRLLVGRRRRWRRFERDFWRSVLPERAEDPRS